MRRSAFFVALVFLSVYGYFTLTGPRGIPGVLAKRREIRELEEKNADLAREVVIKRDRIRKLTSSESEQGRQIRESTQKVQPGDVEFMLPNRPKLEKSASPEP